MNALTPEFLAAALGLKVEAVKVRSTQRKKSRSST
jgi:hypothetical protein